MIEIPIEVELDCNETKEITLVVKIISRCKESSVVPPDPPDPPVPDNDIDAPVIYRIWSSTDGAKVYIQVSKPMLDPVGQHAKFTVSGSTVTAVGLRSGTTDILELTLSTPVGGSSEYLVGYTRGTVQAVDLGYLQAFGPILGILTTSMTTIALGEKWDFWLDATDDSLFSMSGNNVLIGGDRVDRTRFYRAQGTAYATRISDVINVIALATNQYELNSEIRVPAPNKFTLAIKYIAPALASSQSDQTMYFGTHSSAGTSLTLPWSSVVTKRNSQLLITAPYYSNSAAQPSLQSPMTNDGLPNYVVFTYDGVMPKMFANGVYIARTATRSTSEIFNRLLSANVAARAPYGLICMGMGMYMTDDEVNNTLNPFLSTYA